MPTKERARDRGRRDARRIRAELAEELRTARLITGVSQAHVARIAGTTQSSVSRSERATQRTFTLEGLATHLAALGMRLSIKAYPAGPPVRDRAHLTLLGRFRACVSDRFEWRSEAPVGPAGDLRAWDVRLTAGVRIGVDAETRLYDIQAVQRRMETKARDSGVDRMIMLVLDSRRNRRVLAEHAPHLRATFPADERTLRAALRAGRDPGGNGLLRL